VGAQTENQGGSVVLGARAVGVDLLDAAAGEGRKLFHDCAIDQDAEAAATHGAMLERPAIDHHLAWLVRRALDSGGKRYLIARPGHVEVGNILNPECDPDQRFWALQSYAVDSIVYGLTEEVGLVRRMWRLSTPNTERVRQCQRSAKSPAMTITTVAGHVSTVVVFDCSAR
jgi:hypothetical protein